jgi:hypothetical protein
MEDSGSSMDSGGNFIYLGKFLYIITNSISFHWSLI